MTHEFFSNEMTFFFSINIEYFLGLDPGNGMTALVHRSAIKIGPTSPLDMNERRQGSQREGPGSNP